MMQIVYSLVLFFIVFDRSHAFGLQRSINRVARATATSMISDTQNAPVSFKSEQLVSLNRKMVLSFAAFSAVLSQKPKNALAGSLEDANNKLVNYGLPPILFVPPGFQPIVSEFGRGNAKAAIENPILVQFCAPNVWIVKRTSVNNNGESGTISANDYQKGDSAFLFTAPIASSSALSVTNKQFINELVQKSLSQKGDALESFKVEKVYPGAKGVDGREYILADVKYAINTEAGFLINRKGVVSLTAVGSQVQALVSVTTDKRWKTLEGSIRDIANTFRVYKLESGIFAGQ